MLKVFIYIVFVIITVWAMMFVYLPFYLKWGWFKFLYHDIMGFHLLDMDNKESIDYRDGNFYGVCKFCKKNIVLDKDGRWVCLKEEKHYGKTI